MRALGLFPIAALVATGLAGCDLTIGTPPRAHPATHASPSPVAVAVEVATRPNPGAGLITDLGSGLTGVVRAPATLLTDAGGSIVANHGAGIVANNGGGVIANNGGGIVSNDGGSPVGKTSRRLLAIDEPAVAGLLVTVIDAGGKPVLDAGGKPLATTTDATGHYRFKDFKPPHNVLLSVDLHAKGSLLAIAPKDATSSDLDLVSTLTTGYILDQYVKPQQADPTTTLDKLPAEVEATTRAKAATALAADGSVPPRLTPADIDPAMDALRHHSQDLDQQLDTVKKLLVAAGQSDLGSGRLGTDVTLGDIHGLVLAPDGSLYLAETDANRVWKLLPDGHIVTAIGSGAPATTSVDGLSGPDAGIVTPIGLAIDAAGRLLVVENTDNTVSGGINNASIQGSFSRVTRLGTDGKVEQLWSSTDRAAVAAYAGPGDEVRVLVADVTGEGLTDVAEPAELLAIGADRKPRQLHAFTAAESIQLSTIHSWGVDAAGRLLATAMLDVAATDPLDGILALDPTTFAVSTVVSAKEGDGHGYMVDPTGDVLDYFNGQLARWQPTGDAPGVLPPSMPPDAIVEDALLTPDAGAYAVFPDGVYHVTGGKLVKRIGASSSTTQHNAGDVSLQQLTGLAAAPGGGIYVADKQLYKLSPGGKLAPTGLNVALGDHPGPFHTDASGTIFLCDVAGLQVQGVSRVDPTGQLVQVLNVPDGVDFTDFAVAADGTLAFAGNDSAMPEQGASPRVYAVGPDGTPKQLFSFAVPGQDATPDLAFAPDGSLYVVGGGQLRRWTAKAGVTVVKADPRFVNDGTFNAAGIAVDARGRLYIPSETANTIVQYDPSADTFKTVAGKGGTHFTGTGVDDSILNPHFVAFDAAGNLYFADIGHKQVKRIPANEL